MSAGARGGVRAARRARLRPRRARRRQLDGRRAGRDLGLLLDAQPAVAPAAAPRARHGAARGREHVGRARSGACASRSAAPSSRACATGLAAAWGGGPTHGEGRVRRRRASPRAGRAARGSRVVCSMRFRLWRRMSRSSRSGAARSPGAGALRQKLAALRQDVGWYGEGLGRAARRARSGPAALPDVPRAAAPAGAAGGRDGARPRRPARARLVPGLEPDATAASSMPRAIRLADRVVCVSRATARDVSGLLGVPESRVRVVPNGDRRGVLGAGGRQRRRAARTSCSSGRPSRARTSRGSSRRLMRLVDEGRPERLVLAGADGWGGVELPGARSHHPARTRRRRHAPRPLRACPMRRLPVTLGGLRARRRRGARHRLPRRVLGPSRAARGRRLRRRLLRPRARSSRSPTRCARALDGERPAPRRALTWEAAARRSSRCGGSSPREQARSSCSSTRTPSAGHGRAMRRTRSTSCASCPSRLRTCAFAASLRDPAAMPDDVPQSVRRLALPVAVAVPAHPVRASAPRPPRRRGAAARPVLRRPAPVAAVRRDGARPRASRGAPSSSRCVTACCSADSCRARCAAPAA